MNIWKFVVHGSMMKARIPEGGKVVHCVDNAFPPPGFDPSANTGVTFWAEVDPDAPLVEYDVVLVGTGFAVPENGKFLGTFFRDPYVWHLYLVPA